MSESAQGSSFSAFWRLMRYARPFRGRLIAGIVAVIAVGGSIFGMLANIDRLVAPIESGGQVEAVTGQDYQALGGLIEWLEGHDIPAVTEEGEMKWQLMALSVVGILTVTAATVLFVLDWFIGKFGKGLR